MSGTSTSDDHVAKTLGDDQAAEQGDLPRFVTVKRVSMAAATAFLSINIWTGAPLLALWVGSQVSGQTVLSMKAVFVVVLVLAVLVVALAMALTWLNNTYDELIGRPRTERRTPWLRSMRAESGAQHQQSRGDNGARADRHDERVPRGHHVRDLVLLLCWIPAYIVDRASRSRPEAVACWAKGGTEEWLRRVPPRATHPPSRRRRYARRSNSQPAKTPSAWLCARRTARSS